MSKKTTAIYNALSANGDFKGSEQDFNKKFFAPGKAGYEYRKGVYDTLHKGGADVGSSYEEFGQLIGLRAVPRQQQQVQQPQQPQAIQKPKPTTSTPMTDAEKRAMIGNTADMVAQTGQQIAQTGRAIEHAKRHTGLDVRTPKLGQNRNVDKVQDPVSGQAKYETEDGQVYDNEAYATQAQNEYDQAKQHAGESELDRELREAKQQQADLEEALRKRREELDNGGKGFFGKMLESAAQATRPDVAMHHNNVADYEQDEEYGQLMAAVRQNRGAIQVLEDKKNNKMNSFWHSFATTAANGYTFGDGRAELNDAIALTNAQKRLAQINAKRERGEMLTREEESAEQVLTAALRNQAMQGKYGEEYGGWAIAGAGAPVSLDMMKNMLLGGGIFQNVSKGVAKGIAKAGLKQVAKASTKGLLKGASRTAAKGLVKATGVTLGSLAGGALVSNTTGLTKTLGEAAKGATGNVGVDKQGNFQFENQKGLMSALAEAERSQIGENASEMFGEFLPDIGIGKLAIRGLEKIGLSKMAGFLTSMGGKQWAKQYAQVLRASGFNGMPNEALEEYAGILYNQLTGDSDNGLKTLADVRTHRDIWLGTATVGALMGAPNVVMAGAGAAQYYRYKHAMERAAKNANYRLTEEKWKPLQEAIDNTPNEGLTDLMMDIYGRKDMEMPEKKAVYDYIHNLVKYRGYNIGTINFNDSRKAENDPKQNADMEIEGAADAAYTDGYNAQGIDMARAKREYDNATMRVVEVLGSDVVDALSQEPVLALKKLHNDGALEDDAIRDAATAFVNAKMKFDGVVQRAKDDLDGMITDARNSISQRTHQDGAIHPVTLKEDDKRAYVVDGNVAMLDDGETIDTQNSDETIIIRGEDGKLEFTSPSAIMSVGDLIDPAEERKMAEQTITQDFGRRRAAEIDGIDENGQPIPLGDEGEQEQVQQGEVPQTEPQPQQADTTEQDTQETSEQDGTQPMPMVKNKEVEEEPDFMSATPQRAHQYIYNEAELPRDVADEFVKNNAKAAQSHLDKVKKKQPKMGTSIAKYKAEQAAYAQEVQAAEQAVQYWDEVKAVQDAIDKQQREEMLAKQAAAAAEAKKVEEARQAQEVAKQDEQEEVIGKAVEIPKQSVQQDVTDGREDKENEPEQGVKADETTGVTKGADDTLEESGARDNGGNAGEQETEPAATGVERATQGNVANNESKTEVDDSKEELKILEDFISSTDSNKRTALNEDEYDAEELYAPLLLDGKKSSLAVTINLPSRITDPSYPIALYDFEHSVNEFDWEMMENALEEYNSHVKEEDKTHMWGDSGKLAFRSVDAAVKFNDWMPTKESKAEKHNDKQEDLMSKAERIVKEIAEQGKIEPVPIKDKRPIPVIEFAEKDKKKNEVRPALSGVYHDGGYVVATDGFVLLARKEGYDKSLEGKVTDQKGNMVATAYPKWQKLVSPANGYSAGVEINGLHSFVRGVFVKLKSKKANKRNRSPIGIAFKDANGEIRLYNANNLDKFLSGMESIGAKDIIVDASLGGLYAASAHGYVVVMPTPVQNLDAGIFVYEPTSEEGKEHQKSDLVTREEVEHGEKENLDKKTAEEIKMAEDETDTNPTEAQKESGNYRKGHVRIDGMEISIEQPKGSVRRGTDDKGNKWESEMHNTYGYIRGTQSVDGDHIDVFLSDAPLHGMVYVVDQVNPETGKFDEHKVMYGFESEDAARKAYLSNYEKGWKGLGTITEVSREDFKEWVQSSKRKTKPFAEYKSVKASKETKGDDTSAANAVLSQKDYVQKRLSEDLANTPYKTLDEWETADIEGYSEQYDNMIAEYPSYLRELAKSEKLQEIYDRSSVKEQKKIREHLEDADIDYKEVLNTFPQRTRVQDRITEEIKYAKGVFSDGTIVYGKVVGQTNESVTIEQNGRKYTIKTKDILEQSDEPISVDKAEFQVDKNNLSTTTDEQELATNAVLSLLENAGIPVEVVSDETAKKIIPENAEKRIVYHGSSAKFEHFDHSHMGEGEGAQAYGWGSYVTEVEGIGRSYAVGNGKIKFRGFVLESMHSLEVKEHFSKAERKVLNFLYRWIKRSDNASTAIEKAREWASNEYGKYSGRRDWSDQDYKEYFGAISKREVREWRKEMKEKEENAQQMLSFIETLSVDDFSLPQRHLYTVNIPDDTGSNYLSWERPMTVEQLDAIEAYLKENFRANSVQVFTDGITKSAASNSEEVDAFTRRGENIYHLLEHILYDDKSVSKMLHSLGYTGISYPAEHQSGGREDGARNYVIFNEKDLKITDHVQFMKTPQGTIYGWTVGGKVYLTEDGLNPETPIHEYTHIWAEAMRRKNSDGWNSVKALLKGAPVWDEVLNDPNYQNIKDDEDGVASEVLSRISGRENAKKFEEQAKKTLAGTRGFEEKAQVANLISNVRRALNKFWNWVGKGLFGIKEFNSIEEVADRVLYDLTNGTDLSEVKNDEVQFHKAKSEDDTKTLMGVHNITEDKLLKAIKMGGFANPSAAIIDTSKGIHNNYGEISLIMPSYMIDKRTGRNAGTFEGDAWTPMYPSVEKRMTPNGNLQMEEDINDVPKEMQHSIRAALSDWIKSYANTALHYLFLHQRGNAPDIQFPKSKYSDEIIKAVSSLMNGSTNIYTLPKETIKKLTDVYIDFEFDGDKEAFRANMDELIAKSKNTLERNKEGSILYKSAQLTMDDVADYGYPLSPIARFVKDVQDELSLTTRPDVQGTLAKASEVVEHEGLSKDYEDWLRGLDNRYEAKEEIFDGFTPSGKRRYVPNTLENVSKLMKKQGRQSSVGISTFFSNFAASVMKSNNTLANIKKKKGKLTSNHQGIEDFENKWKGVYLELGEKLQPDAGAFDDYGLARLQEAAVEKDPQAYLKGEYGITLSDEDAQKLRDLIKAIQEEKPAMYFETKFERPVMLEEFAAAVIPSNLDKKARVALQDAGLAIYEYEPGNKEDRKRAVDEAKQEDDVLFRQKDNLDEDLKLEDVLVPTSTVRMPRKPRHNIKAYLNGKSVNRDNMLSVAQQLTKGEPFSLDNNTMLREIKGIVDFSDYYDGTIAEFKALPSDGKTVYEQWEELKAKGYEWHKSPLSNSEYLIDKETGDIYRYANHWGSVASCTWELVGAYDEYNYHIAVCNISDFKAKGYGRIAYPNVSYLQALNQSIVNVKDVLNDPTIDIKPKGREFLENILRDRETRRSDLLNDNDNLIDNRNVRKKRAAEPKPREEDGQVERSRETYTENKVREMETAVTDAAAKMNLGNVVVITSADGLDGQKKRAKGWFDRRTGKITIVLGNHTSVEDAIKTLMHEAVAHYGLRKLFGKDFDTFLYNVYRNAPLSIRRKIVQMSIRHGWNARVATEEYLASLAEDTEFENAKESGWFNRIKEFFVGMMHRLIERDKLINFGEDELRYILWRSYENLTGNGGIMGEAQDVVKRKELLGGTRTAGEPNILFRQIDQDKIDFDKAIARGKYEHRMRESGFQTVEAIQDSMKSLMELYKAVDEAEKVKREVEDIPDSENAYVGENRLSSVNQAELDDYNRRFFKPLLNSIGALARTDEERQDLFDYMMAKHGLERNEVMALREAQKEYEELNQAAVDGKGTAPDWDAILAKHRKRDYSGLTTLMRGDEDEIDTATAEQRAKELVGRYEEEKGKADIDNLWYDVNAANAEVLWKMYRGGLLSKEAYHEIADMYKYYIPLRGFDEKTSGEEYAYLMGKNSAFTAPMKTAKGRTSKADNPIAQMALMADSAIMQANRNRLVKIPFLNYVTKHPSDLVSVSDMWLEYDEVNDTWKPKFPEISPEDTPEEVERKVGEFEEKMEELSAQQPDKYVRQGEKGNIPYRVLGSDMREHQVIVKRNGKDYVLTINGNPRAAQAINGLTNPDNKSTGAIDKVFDWIAQGNRWLSAAYTTRNPDFVVSNFIRDTFYSNVMVHVKEGRNYATKFHINHAICNPVMIGRLLHKYNNGELDMNNELQRYFYEFMMNGGETGWTSVKNAEQHKSDIKKTLDRGAVGKSVKKIFEGLDHLNRAIENSARFAAFVTSRQMGRQLGRSIYDAKEISVNFNKKGSGSKMLGATGQTWQGNTAAFVSGIGRGLYTFWNASVQGLTNYMRYTHRNPAKGYSLATALFGLGLLIPYVGYLMSGGDDDGNGYYDMPEYVRRSNILIKAGNGWAKIALPQEYRAIYGMGELAMTIMSGQNQMTRGEALLSAAEQLSQVLPIDFMEGGGSWRAAVPTALKPIVEASINRSWTGLPIYRDNPFNKDDPEWAKSYESVNGELKAVTKWLSDNTGGDDYTGGAIDLNPAQIEYVMKGMLGGYYSFMDKVVKTAKMPFGAQPVEAKDIPFVNRLYVTGDERTKERAINNAYFKFSKEHDHTKKLLRNYEREAEQGSEKYIEKINLMYNEPAYARYLIFEEYSKDIDRLGKMRKEVQGDPEAMLEIDKQIADLRKDAVNKLREVK